MLNNCGLKFLNRRSYIWNAIQSLFHTCNHLSKNWQKTKLESKNTMSTLIRFFCVPKNSFLFLKILHYFCYLASYHRLIHIWNLFRDYSSEIFYSSRYKCHIFRDNLFPRRKTAEMRKKSTTSKTRSWFIRYFNGHIIMQVFGFSLLQSSILHVARIQLGGGVWMKNYAYIKMR